MRDVARVLNPRSRRVTSAGKQPAPHPTALFVVKPRIAGKAPTYELSIRFRCVLFSVARHRWPRRRAVDAVSRAKRVGGGFVHRVSRRIFADQKRSVEGVNSLRAIITRRDRRAALGYCERRRSWLANYLARLAKASRFGLATSYVKMRVMTSLPNCPTSFTSHQAVLLQKPKSRSAESGRCRARRSRVAAGSRVCAFRRPSSSSRPRPSL